MEELADEFREWQRDNEHVVKILGFDLGAEELLMIDGIVHRGSVLTDEHREWLRDFITRWDRQQALVDRLARLVA